MPRKQGASAASNQIRIIGGKWRGRKLSFPTVEGLRPTGDRVRETLFNWLGQNLSGSRVLDLFAGSGSLGIEALSRGAESALFVDASQEACKNLKASLTLLETENCFVHCQHAEEFLRSSAKSSVDLLFLDPPFAKNLHMNIARLVTESGILATDALIYIESPAKSRISLPSEWTELKNKKAGDVRYQLFQVDCDNRAI